MSAGMPVITSAGQALKVTPKPLGQERWELASPDTHPIGIQFHSSWSKETTREGIPRYLVKGEAGDQRHALLIITRFTSSNHHLFAVNHPLEGCRDPDFEYPAWYHHILNSGEGVPFKTHAYRMTMGIEFCLVGAEALMVMHAGQSLRYTTQDGDLNHPGDATLEKIDADESGQLFTQLEYGRVDVIPLDASGICDRLIGTGRTPELVVPVNAGVALKVKDNPDMAVPICHHHRIILPEAHAAYLCAGAGYCVSAIPNAPMRQMGTPLLIRVAGLFTR